MQPEGAFTLMMNASVIQGAEMSRVFLEMPFRVWGAGLQYWQRSFELQLSMIEPFVGMLRKNGEVVDDVIEQSKDRAGTTAALGVDMATKAARSLRVSGEASQDTDDTEKMPV